MVPFAKSCLKFIFAGEQFWGKAARAPRSRKRFEALVILGREILRWSGSFTLRFHVLGLNVFAQDLTLKAYDLKSQLVEMVKLTVILASVSTASLPSR